MKGCNLLLFIFSLLGCSNPERNKPSTEFNEGHNSENELLPRKSDSINLGYLTGNGGYNSKNELLSRKSDSINLGYLRGNWFSDITANASFSIEEDSILYVDNLRSYKYEVHIDTLVLHFDDGLKNSQLILKLTIDSLILMDMQGRSITQFTKP